MMKKVMTGLIALAFVASCSLVMFSCASQQTMKGEETGGAAKGPADTYTSKDQIPKSEMSTFQEAVQKFSTEKIFLTLTGPI